jgi:hypothetical protein
VSGLAKRYPAGPVLIKTLPRKPRPWPVLARIMVRQHDLGNDRGLIFALGIFGPRICAEELFERYRDEYKQAGRHKYRDEAIDKAADRVGLDRDKFRNWINRSKSKR